MRLRDRLGDVEAAGGKVAAISVDSPEESRAFLADVAADGGALGFALLSDPGGAAARAFGVFDHKRGISLPAILILDRGRERKLVWKFVGDTVFDRPEEETVIAALRGLRDSEAVSRAD